MSYPMDISISNICIRDIASSYRISLGYLHSISQQALSSAPAALGALQLLRAPVATAFFAALFESPLLCAAPQSQRLTGPAD